MYPSLDVRILLDLNSLTPDNSPAVKVMDFIGNNLVFRGFPIFFPLAALWFSSENRERRSRMLAGLLATGVGAVVSVWIQGHFHSHIRPFLDPTLHLQGINPEWATGWSRLDSFPSDTATMVFCLGTVIFLENKLVGCIAMLWSLFTIDFERVAQGWHYPSDIAGGFVLGVTCVLLLTHIRPLRVFLDWLLKRYEQRMYIVDAFVVLFLADAYSFFHGLQGVHDAVKPVARYLIKLV
jgi:undecaprenyl-diphosphatase